MKREDVIRMAREAASDYVKAHGMELEDPSGPELNVLERFADLVAAAEREACAKVCEKSAGRKVGRTMWAQGYDSAAGSCAAAIRARGNQ